MFLNIFNLIFDFNSLINVGKVELKNKQINIDLSKPIDISIPLIGNVNDVNAWYVNPMKIEPVRTEQFVGSVEEGGNVNFRNIFFNPHGNGTHTECVGHIAEKVYSINDTLKTFFFLAELVSIAPESYGGKETEWKKKGDLIITKEQLEKALAGNPEAILIRTLPNESSKLSYQYSNTNWPYLEEEAAQFIAEKGIKHLLIDLPSVDRENDGGKMLAHRAFWNYPENTRFDATITELIYVPDNILDGEYLLNIQIASFENDASPSKPILYKIK